MVPSGWVYNEELDTVDVTGRDVANTKKWRDVRRSGRKRSSLIFRSAS